MYGGQSIKPPNLHKALILLDFYTNYYFSAKDLLKFCQHSLKIVYEMCSNMLFKLWLDCIYEMDRSLGSMDRLYESPSVLLRALFMVA